MGKRHGVVVWMGIKFQIPLGAIDVNDMIIGFAMIQ
jgi:hypothetical protein